VTSDDDMDDRSDPGERHCDSDVYDGRCVARVSKMLILTSEKEGGFDSAWQWTGGSWVRGKLALPALARKPNPSAAIQGDSSR
jgi:hypothetical protein